MELISEDFLMMIPGTIGNISYNYKYKNPENQRECAMFVDKYAAAEMQKLITDTALGGWGIGNQEPLPPGIIYSNARQKAYQMYQQQLVEYKIRYFPIQVGNKEDLDFLDKIERLPEFISWTDPLIIELFRNETIKLIKNNE